MTEYVTPEHPIQTYLAEEVDPAWLLSQHDRLVTRSKTTTGDGIYKCRARLASNLLELGINQGENAFLEDAFDNFDYLVRHPQGSVYDFAFFKAQALLCGREAFQARARRQTLSTAAMSTVYIETMDILDGFYTRKVRPPVAYLYMADLIAFGALAREQRDDRFPYITTYREADGPGGAAHDVYALEKNDHHGIKHPAAIHQPKDRQSPVRVSDIIHDLSQRYQAWYWQMGAPVSGPDVKRKRYDITARLLQGDARCDPTLLGKDYAVLGALTHRVMDQIIPRPKPEHQPGCDATSDSTRYQQEAPPPLRHNPLADKLRGFTVDNEG